MSFANTVVAQVLGLETSLYHIRARLQAGTDKEALHDLRITLRRLRSLLRPLGGTGEPLIRAASELGRLAGPARDLEVLAMELQRRGFLRAGKTRSDERDRRCENIVTGGNLEQVFIELERWSRNFRKAERNGRLRYLGGKAACRLHKQFSRLALELAERRYDPHRMRILVKRARYAAEAYPRLSLVSPELAEALKRAQTALGDWHDRDQWIQATAQSRELGPLQAIWKREAEVALNNAEVELLKLSQTLEEHLSPKRKMAMPSSSLIVFRVEGNEQRSLFKLRPVALAVRT
ncbi:CHAD domain-containing protein [Pseudomonas sp. BN417]|uniref:CHAD domain-containing protein n=1 Tax=Pseudomonas sp. BN417 TaxID=2567890 RepID=UPI00245749B9|nr:CHAD domain-containing protein [Pseudomonas sp. BN417]